MEKIYTLPVFNFVFNEDTIAADVEAAAFIPEVWANRVLGYLHGTNPIISACLRDYSNEVASQGDTVRIQERGTLVANDKSPNTTVTLQNPTASTQSVILDNHKEVSFIVEDVAEAQSNVAIMDGYIEDGAKVISSAIEAALAAEYANITAGNVLEFGSDTLAGTIAARTKIVVDGKAPSGMPRYLIIKDLADLITYDKFINKDYIAQGVIETGQIGSINGFIVKESSQIVTTVSPSQVHRLCFAKESLALVSRRLPSPPKGSGATGTTIEQDGIGLRVVTGYNLDFLAMQVSIDILFGTKIIRPTLICELV